MAWTKVRGVKSMSARRNSYPSRHTCFVSYLFLCFVVSVYVSFFVCSIVPDIFVKWQSNHFKSNLTILGCKIIWRILTIVTLNIQSEPAFLVNLARALARYLSLLTSDGPYLLSQQQVFIHDCSCFCCRKKWKSGDVSPSLLDGLLIFSGCFRLVIIWEDKTSM